MNMDGCEPCLKKNKLMHTSFQSITNDEETNFINEINTVANLKSQFLPSGFHKRSDLNKLYPIAVDLDMRNGPYLEINKFMKMYLNNERKDQCLVLSQLMKALLKFRTTVLAEKLFLLRCTCYVLLYRDGPPSFCIQQTHFLQKMLRTIINDERRAVVESDWVKIEWYAKTIYDFLVEDIYNFDYAIRLIANGNSVLHHAAIAAVLGTFKKFTTGEHPKIFHVWPVAKFIRDLGKINLSIFKNNLQELHHFLIIISLYQNLVIIPGIVDKSLISQELYVSKYYLNAYLGSIQRIKMFAARMCVNFSKQFSIQNQIQLIMDFDILAIYNHPNVKKHSWLFLNLGLHMDE